MVLKFATAADSFAACRDRSKLGIAIVAMIRMIATTISNSKSEKPRLFFIQFPLHVWEVGLRDVVQNLLRSLVQHRSLRLQPHSQFVPVRESMGYPLLFKKK